MGLLQRNTFEPTAPIAMRPKDAAKALGISERTLWEHTQPRGPIPCVRVVVCVLYRVKNLEEWMMSQTSEGAPSGEMGAPLE